MSHKVERGDTETKIRFQKLPASIVLNDVVIREREQIVDIPKIKYNEVVYEKPIIKEKETLKYNTVEVENIKYITKEEITKKYIPTNEPTIKYDIREEETIKYIPLEVPVEKPIMVEKTYHFVSKDTIELIERFVKCIEDLGKKLPTLERNLEGRSDFKLIEEVIRFLNTNGMPSKE